jgi:hypothetical protein
VTPLRTINPPKRPPFEVVEAYRGSRGGSQPSTHLRVDFKASDNVRDWLVTLG